MKRIILGLTLGLALLAAPRWAAAQATDIHWVYDPVAFRTHSATVYGTDGIGGVDSSAASGIAKFDTTAGISTAGWAFVNASGTGTDSTLTARLFIYDSGLATVTLGKTSATAESLYVKVQVSVNNVDWHDAAPIPGTSPVLNALTLPGGANPGVVAQTSSTNTGISGKMWSIRYVQCQGAASLRDGKDIYHAFEFPWVRWIVYGSRSLNHSYSALVGHFTTSAQKSP